MSEPPKEIIGQMTVYDVLPPGKHGTSPQENDPPPNKTHELTLVEPSRIAHGVMGGVIVSAGATPDGKVFTMDVDFGNDGPPRLQVVFTVDENPWVVAYVR